MRRFGFHAVLWMLLAGLVSGAGAQQRMTNVAVIDVSKVQTAYFTDSARFKEWTEFKAQYDRQVAERKATVDDLRIRRSEANRVGNQAEVTRLDGLIATAEAENQTYIRLQEQKRVRLVNELMSTDKFFRDLVAAVQWVCNQEGYALALNKQETQLLWWDPLIDITEKVIRRMAEQ